MVEYSEKDEALTFRVQVVPRASRNEIAGEHNGALRVRIAAPPVDGAANEALARTLARGFGVPLKAVEIISGQAARAKRVRVAGVRAQALAELLRK